MIMIESEGITENVKSWRTDVISAITSALPAEKIMCVVSTRMKAINHPVLLSGSRQRNQKCSRTTFKTKAHARICSLIIRKLCN